LEAGQRHRQTNEEKQHPVENDQYWHDCRGHWVPNNLLPLDAASDSRIRYDREVGRRSAVQRGELVQIYSVTCSIGLSIHRHNQNGARCLVNRLMGDIPVPKPVKHTMMVGAQDQ
jgi:hypothetical protein